MQRKNAMPLSNRLIHIIPLQISIKGSNAIITCNDPRARIVEDELELRLNSQNADDPPAEQRVCFTVEDLPNADRYDHYFNVSSAPPLERLEAWKRTGSTSQSPEFRVGYDYEIVVVSYAVPHASTDPNATAKTGHGRRIARVRDPGASGGDIF